MTANSSHRAMTRRRLLTLGYVVCDVVGSNGSVAYSAGGSAANVAANLAVLGWDVALYAKLGADVAGHHVRNDLAEAGVEVTPIEMSDDVLTPVVVVDPSRVGRRYLFRCPKCGTSYGRHRPVTHVASEALDDIDVIYFDRASLAAVRLAEHAQRLGKLVIFEPNTPGRSDLFQRAMMAAQLVKYSAERGETLRHFLDGAPSQQFQIQTLGAEGCMLRRGGGPWRSQPAPVVTAVDAVGAGDMLTSALLYLALNGVADWPRSIRGLGELMADAQWFAAANCQEVGPRALTTGRTREEVLSRVEELRSGLSSGWRSRATSVIGEFENACQRWLCPTVSSSPALLGID
jgi:fructokinase